MKLVVRLVIVVAALLLVTNMAFAKKCDQELCYDVIITDEYGASNDTWEVCLNDEDGTGSGRSLNHSDFFDISLFGGGPGWFNTSGDPAIGGNPRWSIWIVSGEDQAGFLQPIGDGYMITGAGEREGTRSTLQGIKVPCPSEP